ncbi:hypothetical protein C8F01DRAFT_1363611 [Mycena amicta]|nr:hypothetical protein C8F01DRAFT_1363611 [Mycena amicta]
MSAIQPFFPRDLEREIFETAGRLHRGHLPTLLRVAQRVQVWLRPLLYRVVRPKTMAQSVALIHAMQSEPEFLRGAIQRVCLDSDTGKLLSDEQYRDLLALCTRVNDLVLVSSPNSTLPRLAEMQNLKRLTCSVQQLFGNIGAIEFGHLGLSTITHLEMTDSFFDLAGEKEPEDDLLSGVVHMPSLSHLACFTEPGEHISWSRVRRLLDILPRLKIFAFVWPHSHIRFHLKDLETAGVLDIRFMAATFSDDIDIWLDWEQSAYDSALDYWDRGEIFLERKKKGEVKATRYWMDDWVDSLQDAQPEERL